MKVVIDTNVLISGLLSSAGSPAYIIDLWVSNKFTVFITSEILEEYLSVILRPKLTSIGSSNERYNLVSALIDLDNTIMINPEFKIKTVIDNPDDNVENLECAVEAKSDAIISGDDHLLNLAEFEGIPILKPIDFLQRFF